MRMQLIIIKDSGDHPPLASTPTHLKEELIVHHKVRPYLALSLAAALSPQAAFAQQHATELETISVSATRAGSTAGETPQKISVISREEIEAQTAFSDDPSQVLSKLLPSFSPARQKLTNSGET